MERLYNIVRNKVEKERQKMEYTTLNNGIKMPIIGYGVYQVTKDECERCVLDALKAGYRSLDTAGFAV